MKKSLTHRLPSSVSAQKTNSPTQKAFIVVFLLCFSYWAYLIFASQMYVRWDAVHYEALGSMIYEKGWIEYFKTGPNREPLYPLIISFSMRLGDLFSMPYQIFQKIIQTFMLFITQILAFILLNKLKVCKTITLITVLYIGFSPALVNSAMSLFSEIVVIPLVLLIVLCTALTWRSIYQDNKVRTALLSIKVALLFLLTTFSKGIFEYIFFIFLIPFFCVAIWALVKRQKGIFINSILYVIICVVVFQTGTHCFKSLNKKYNGNYWMTNRGIELFVGNVFKKTDVLTPRESLAHVASTLGGGVCRKFFSEQECRERDWRGADYARRDIYKVMLAHLPMAERHKEASKMAFDRIRERPLRYFLFVGFEALRMPFWESTQVGFVTYPKGLSKLFETVLFKNGLRFVLSVLTFLSLFYLCRTVIKNRAGLFDLSSHQSQRVQISFFMLWMIGTYTAFYALFSIVTRYALPISPLYLISIALFLQERKALLEIS